MLANESQDYGEVINLLWKCYYPDEPTYAALKLGYKYHPIFDQLAYDCLQDGISYLAKCSFTYEVVGGCLNKICCPWDPDDLDKLACKMHSPDVRSFYQFRAYIQRTPCLWQNYCTDRVFELKKLFVRRQDRRRGIAKSLIQASRKLGADSGQKVVRLDATNMFIDRLCTKLKMKMVYDIPYCSYTGNDPEHSPVIKAPPPHTGCRVFIDTPLYEYIK
ncbi:hypothetical protein FQR65_LT07093 [Abscondita terminalis]|nr:hypothetical protein FQR65_LT07093 [Abscondita terminalis]